VSLLGVKWFHEWLERLKDEDPEQYAQLLSEYIFFWR
jgi:hypothetical protein